MPAKDDDRIEVKVADLARALDLSPRRVQQLAREGIIPRAGRGRYDIVEACAAYIQHLRRTGDLEGPVLDPSHLKPTEKKAWYDAENTRIDFELRTKTLMRRQDAERAVGAVMSLLVQFLETLGDRAERAGYADRILAGQLGVWGDVLRDELHKALTSQEFLRSVDQGNNE